MIHTFSSESDGQDSSTILPAAMQGLLDEKVHFNVGSGEQKLKRTPFDPIIEIILVLWISRNLLNSYLLASGKKLPTERGRGRRCCLDNLHRRRPAPLLNKQRKVFNLKTHASKKDQI